MPKDTRWDRRLPPGGLRPQLLHKPRQLPVRLQRLRQHILWWRISTRLRQHPSRNRHGIQHHPRKPGIKHLGRRVAPQSPRRVTQPPPHRNLRILTARLQRLLC